MALTVRAAGGVIVRAGDSGPEVLLVHRPRYDDWTFPKGKAEPGESDEETAVREVAEETGYHCALGQELPTTQYRDSRGRPKTVRYWTMAVQAGEFEPHREVDEIRWVGTKVAGSELTYERDVRVLSAVPEPVLVVRHASAGDRADWYGDDARRQLDERGRRQAAALVEQLEPYGVRRIVASPFDRCVQTVEPLAHDSGLEVERSDDLAEGADPERVRRFLLELGPGAVVCMHRPELEPLYGKVKKGGTVVAEPSGLLELGRLAPLA